MADRIVYSTETGDHRATGDRGRKPGAAKQKPPAARDGIVRVRRESKGRGGKTVTVIEGVPLPDTALAVLAADLKRRCGTGGTVKDRAIIIQGDQADACMEFLTTAGYRVKRSGA